jgi:hypothetical protein
MSCSIEKMPVSLHLKRRCKIITTSDSEDKLFVTTEKVLSRSQNHKAWGV